MKNLKLLGVLLVSLFLPLVVNAESTKVYNQNELEACIKTSAVCTLGNDIVMKDALFNEGIVDIPSGKTLTIDGNVFVTDAATLRVNGLIKVNGTLNAKNMQFIDSAEDTIGLYAGQSGKISVKSSGVFYALDFWDYAFGLRNDGYGWSPKDGEHLFEECEEGAIVVSGEKTFVFSNKEWKGAIERGGENYAKLIDALDSADKTDTIKLIADVHTEEGIMTLAGAPKNITFDLNGNILDFGSKLVGSPSTVTQNIHLEKGWTIIFKNGTMKASSNAKRFIQNYANLTLEDVVVDASAIDSKYQYSNSFNNGKVNIIGNTSFISNNYAFDVYYWTMNGGNPTSYQDGTQVIIDTTGIIKGDIEVNGDKLPSKSTLKIVNINHQGNLSVVKGYEDNVTIYGGQFTTNVKDLLVDGNYRVQEIDNKFVVDKKLNVLVSKVEGDGDVRFDKETAFSGETVTMTYFPLEGYVFDTVEVYDEHNNKLEVKDNKFVMPSTDVAIVVTFKKTPATIETNIPVLDTKEEVKEVTVGVKEEEKVEKVILDSIKTNKDLAAKIENKEVTVGVEIETLDSSKIDKTVVESIKNKVGKGKVATFFDISIAIRNAKDNTKIDNVAELTNEIELMILLPEELRNTDSKINREYFIVREHDGKVETIKADLSKDGKYLVFKSDKFSTYALAYEDKSVVDSTKVETKPNVEVPKTFDGITATLILSAIALVGFISTGLYLKKQTNK